VRNVRRPINNPRRIDALRVERANHHPVLAMTNARDLRVRNGFMEKVMEISAKQLLMAAITTAVDLGAPLKESVRDRDRIKKGEIPGPHMLMSGPWVTRSLGNYPPEMNVMQKLINTPEEAAAATEELINAGVDVIKAYVQLTPAQTPDQQNPQNKTGFLCGFREFCVDRGGWSL
jgi:hypothetical protein